VTDVERRAALEGVAAEVRACTRCRLHEGRTKAVPGEGDPETEVVFVGEGPGFNEDREGRPFVGKAGGMLVRLLGSIGWDREQVFITNVVKCRPPENRDPAPDEIAACQPFLRRQLEILDPAVVVTLGRHSMGTFLPGARITAAHGTVRHVDPETGAKQALVFPMFHPAAALRAADVERMSYEDVARIPDTLLRARALRDGSPQPEPEPLATPAPSVAAPGQGFAVVAASPGVSPATDLAIDEVPPEPDWLMDAPPLEPWSEAAPGEAIASDVAPPLAPAPAFVPSPTAAATAAEPDLASAILDPAQPDADQLTLF
jgi:uracil-DNA glycosylase